MKKLKIVLALMVVIIAKACAQNLQDSVRQDEKDIVSAIAAYPEDMRNAILDVSQYTPKLIKIERLQSRTSQSFQDLVVNKPREQQEKFYEISRYPELVKSLGGSVKTDQELNSFIASYPTETQKIVRELYPGQASEFKIMTSLLEKSEHSMQSLIGSLPPSAQDNFKKVIEQPDVMTLLSDRIDNVVCLGEAYKEDPDGVKKDLAELNSKISEQNEKDLAVYKKKVEDDPQMQAEMKKSAQQFADSYSANSEGNEEPGDSTSAQQNQLASQPAVNNYYVNYNNPNPYPYWFGYPYWYANPIWYPRPWYYHTGFYFSAGGNVVVMGMPSGYYSGWFFRYGGWRAYPRYYGFCQNYYNVHRTFINRNVNVNVYRGYNRSVNNHFTRINNVTNKRVVSKRANINRTTVNRSNHVNLSHHGNNFNQAHYNNFHAQQFHQHNWSVGRGFSGGRMGGGSGRRR